MRSAAFVVVLLAVRLALPQDGSDLASIENALRSPPATGLLISSVAPGSQADAAGLRPGEVVVSYGGAPVPDQAALDAAKKAAQSAESVAVVVAGPEGERTVDLAPGPVGVGVIPVRKGEPVAPLPPATVRSFDFSALAQAPVEDWYSVTFEGGAKVGFEHSRLSLSHGKLLLRREVAFDGGEQWGLNHRDVFVVADAAPAPEAFATRFLAPLGQFAADGRRAEDGRWVITRDSEPVALDHPRDLPRIPTYLVESLALFLPREPGACFHFRPLVESGGSLSLASALVAVGEEEVAMPGGPARLFRVEQRSLGGAHGGIWWIGREGRIERTDYGGPVVFRCAREEAMAGLPEALTPRWR